MKMVRMKRRGEIPLAVGVVRRMESLLTKISRKRRLTTEHRQSLLRCVVYLRKKRQRQTEGKIIIPRLIWVKALRFLALLVESHEHVKKMFDAMLGDR
jgi:hypothetical protein